MRIAMVSEHANPLAALGGVDAGGQNVHVAALAGGLARRGHDVTVYTRRDDPSLPGRVVAEAGYAVEHVTAGPPTEVPKDELLPFMKDFARHLANRWPEGEYDVVHSHFWMSGLASQAAAASVGLPVVHTFHALGTVKRRHQSSADTSSPHRIRLERWLGHQVRHVIATCTDEVHELERMGMDARRITVIPCGVDTDLFRPGVGDSSAVSGRDRPHRLVVAGRLVPRKGVDDVVAALARLPDAELLIAGGPTADALGLDPEMRRLCEIADALGTTERVRFLGRVDHDDMPMLFGSSDIVVSTPWYEPFGIVSLEAMASGRPFVGSAIGGMLDTVQAGITGELVPPRSPEQLAVALRALLDDPDRRESYGAAGRHRARSRYRWERIAEATEHVYSTVVMQHARETIGARP